MRAISTKKMVEIKESGGTLKVDRSAVREAPKKVDTVEKSLVQLNQYVKQIVTKKDTTEIFMKAANGIMITLGDIAAKIDAASMKRSAKVWDITVVRDEDKLIKYLEMSAREE